MNESERPRALQPGHGWSARPGCKIFVADQGVVRFDYPKDWIVVPDEDCINFYDEEPPDADSCLAVSYLRLPQIDWSALPLRALLECALQEDERPIDALGPIREMQRLDLELAWREVSFTDPAQRREARSRTSIARRSNLQCLITFDFWAADLVPCEAAWDTVLDTLELGEFIRDPTRGPVVS